MPWERSIGKASASKLRIYAKKDGRYDVYWYDQAAARGMSPRDKHSQRPSLSRPRKSRNCNATGKQSLIWMTVKMYDGIAIDPKLENLHRGSS
jgi:hypothetical protein